MYRPGSFYANTQLHADWRPPVFPEDHPTVSLDEAEKYRTQHHPIWFAEASSFTNIMKRRLSSIQALLQSYHNVTSLRVQCDRQYADTIIQASNKVDSDTFPQLVGQHKHFGALITDANRREAVNLRHLCDKAEHLLLHDILFVEFQPYVMVCGKELVRKAEDQLTTVSKLHTELSYIYGKKPAAYPYEQHSYRWEMTYRQYWNAYVSAVAMNPLEELQHQVEVFECKGWALITNFITVFARFLSEANSGDASSSQSPPVHGHDVDNGDEDDSTRLMPGPWKSLLEKLRMMDPMSTQLSVASTASSPTNPPMPVTEFPVIAGTPPVLLKSLVMRPPVGTLQANTEWLTGVLVLTLANEILCFTFDGEIEPKWAAMLGNAHVRMDLCNLTLTVEENPHSTWWTKNVVAPLSSFTALTSIGSMAPINHFVVKINAQHEFEEWRDVISDCQSQARLGLGADHNMRGRVTYSDSGPISRSPPDTPTQPLRHTMPGGTASSSVPRIGARESKKPDSPVSLPRKPGDNSAGEEEDYGAEVIDQSVEKSAFATSLNRETRSLSEDTVKVHDDEEEEGKLKREREGDGLTAECNGEESQQRHAPHDEEAAEAREERRTIPLAGTPYVLDSGSPIQQKDNGLPVQVESTESPTRLCDNEDPELSLPGALSDSGATIEVMSPEDEVPGQPSPQDLSRFYSPELSENAGRAKASDEDDEMVPAPAAQNDRKDWKANTVNDDGGLSPVAGTLKPESPKMVKWDVVDDLTECPFSTLIDRQRDFEANRDELSHFVFSDDDRSPSTIRPSEAAGSITHDESVQARDPPVPAGVAPFTNADTTEASRNNAHVAVDVDPGVALTTTDRQVDGGDDPVMHDVGSRVALTTEDTVRDGTKRDDVAVVHDVGADAAVTTSAEVGYGALEEEDSRNDAYYPLPSGSNGLEDEDKDEDEDEDEDDEVDGAHGYIPLAVRSDGRKTRGSLQRFSSCEELPNATDDAVEVVKKHEVGFDPESLE